MIDPRKMPFDNLALRPVQIEQITANHQSYDAVARLSLLPRIRDREIGNTAPSLVASGKVLSPTSWKGVTELIEGQAMVMSSR